jgi:hypothetical protein
MLTPDPVVMDPKHPDHRQGLIWQLFDWKGAHLAGHHGGDPGAASVAVFDFERHTAALAFANIDDNQRFRPFQNDITFRLLERANSV